MNIEYVVSTMVFWWRENTLSFEQECSYIKSLGFGIEVLPHIKNMYECRFDKDNWDRLKEATQGMTTVMRARTDKITLENWQEQVDCAKYLDARIIADLDSLKVENDPDFEEFEFAASVIQMAEKAGVELAVQTGNLVTIEKLVERFPYINVCFDAGHVVLEGDYPFPDYIDRLKDKIIHLHINDNYGFMDDHQPPGLKGSTISTEDWQYLLDSLKNSQRKIIASLEIAPSMPNVLIRRSCEFLFDKMKWPNQPECRDNIERPSYIPK